MPLLSKLHVKDVVPDYAERYRPALLQATVMACLVCSRTVPGPASFSLSGLSSTGTSGKRDVWHTMCVPEHCCLAGLVVSSPLQAGTLCRQ